MAYSIDINNNIMKIVLPGNLEEVDFEAIVAEIKSMKDINAVFLDFKNCDFIQSKSISQIIYIKKVVISIGYELVLTNVGEAIYQIFEMTNLASIFKFQNDYTSYSPDELIQFFYLQEFADEVSDFISMNYDKSYAEKMYEILESDDYLLKEYAILTIGKAHDYDALTKIKNVLRENVPNVSRACILVLGWFGDTDSKEEIYSFLNFDDESIAESAAASIALLSDETDSLKLKEMLQSADLSLRNAIYRALSLINDEISLDVLIEQLEKENDEDLKATIIKYISFFNKPFVAELLLEKLDDTSLKVRESAASSLIRIKAKDKINAILDKVSDEDSWVGYFATKAIGELADTKDIADALIEKYPTLEDNVKLALIEALGKIGSDCSDFLYQLVDNENEDIRKEALSSIYLINKEMAADAALELLDKEESWIVRFKAVEIIANVKPKNYVEYLKKYLEQETNKYVQDKINIVLEEL